MSIFGFFKKQFVDVIDWNESGDGVLAFRYGMADNEIQNGAQLTVRETQCAMFVNEGEVADIFTPGRYTLSTKTLPLLTSLKNWDKGFQSPFKSDVYFFSTREQIDQRWGTQQPIVVRDKDYGPLRIRAHGTYSYKLKSPQVFFKKVSGTRDIYNTSDLEGQLRSALLTQIASFLANAQVGFLDMASNQQKFSETLQNNLAAVFENYGLELKSFFVQSVSLPEELQSYLDKNAQMKMVGDLRNYAQFQTADSIDDAAANPGGLAGAGGGLGAGVAMSQVLNQSLGNGAGNSTVDPMETLNKLHGLLKNGVLTQAEFDIKKAELLKKIGT